MFNDIQIGPVTFHMYGLMIAIGFAAALFLSLSRAKKRGLDEDIIYGILFCAVIGGLAGTRILFYIVEIPQILKDPSILWNFKEGYVVYGGIIGGVLCSYFYCKKKNVIFADYFDLVMPAVAMAQGFGRLGCFFAGCCYGRLTDSVFGITFSHSSYAPNGVKLIPTQLMSSAGDFAIAAVLLLYAAKKPKRTRVGAAYLMLYGVGRFIIEFFRGDYRGSVGIFSTSQLISFGIIAIGILLYMFASRLKVNKE